MAAALPGLDYMQLREVPEGREQFWTRGANNNTRRYRYLNYIASRTRINACERSALIGMCTIGFAGIGAAAGSGAGPIGAVIGGGVGAGVGATMAISIIAIADCKEYREYVRTLTTQQRRDLEDVLANVQASPDDICPITLSVPIVPVRIGDHRQLYEKEAIIEHMRIFGNNPITKEQCTQADLVDDIRGVANTGKACSQILANPEERAKLTPEQLRGVQIRRQTNARRVEIFHKSEMERITGYLDNGTISPKQYAILMMELAEKVDPAAPNEIEGFGEELAEEIEIVIKAQVVEHSQEILIPTSTIKINKSIVDGITVYEC